MPKRKGTAENKIKPGRENLENNAKIALWGPYAEERYDEARKLAEGWSSASIYEEVWDIAYSEPATLRERQRVIAKSSHLRGKLARLALDTIRYVRAAVERGYGEDLRKFGDVIDHMRKIRNPAEGAGSADLAFVALYVRYKPAHHRFSFNELRDYLAELEGLKPPFDENFDKRVHRIIKKLGIRLRRETRTSKRRQ
jgi:hypothetical protein